MLNKTKKMLATAMISSSIALSGTAIAADFNLRAVANSNENDEDYDGLVVFKDFVEAASNGAIKVDLYIGTQLCANGTECLQAIEDGSVDIYVSTSGGVASTFPYVQMFDLPYVMKNDRVAEEVLMGPFVRELRDQILKDSDGVVRLMTIGNTGGWRNFANTKRTLRTPADFEGLKIRTVVADLPQVLVTALGASPTPIPWPELFSSFQTGVVDGSKNGITDIMGMKFPEAGLKYVTLDGHAYMAALWMINNEVFTSMPEDMRRVIVDGFAALQQATFASPKRKSIQAYREFKEIGGELYVPTPEEKAQLAEAAKPVYEWFQSNVAEGDRFFKAFQAASKEAEAKFEAEYERDLM